MDTSAKNADTTDDRLGRIGSLLTRDYFPGYNRYLNWVRKPLAILIAAAISSALCGLYLHPQGFVLAFGIAALVAVGIVWPWFSLSGLRGSLAFEKSRVVEGDPVVTRILVRNRFPWSVWGISVQAGLPEHGLVADLACIPGWKTTATSWDFVPACRGEFPGIDPKIATGFPFGLRSATSELSVETSMLVWPRTFPVGPLPNRSFGQGSAGAMHRNRVGSTGDILGLRHYRRGDPLRRVHWPQTARQGRLIVCELQAEAQPRAQIVLDVDPAAHAGTGPDGSREWAIRIAASLLCGWISQGADVEAIIGGATIVPQGSSVPARRGKVLDALARIKSERMATLGEMLDLPECCDFRGLRVVVTTDIALERMGHRPTSKIAERFVVLQASAFDKRDPRQTHPLKALPILPWVLVDNPARVPQIIRRVWKEDSLG